MEFTPKQRMLNAYRGIFSDRYPVAPEFWSYYPAKLLGLTILEMEQTMPQWQALKYSFEKFGTEGWGAIGADIHHPDVSVRSSQKRVREDLYEWRTETKYGDTTFVSLSEHPVDEPAWATKYMVDDPEQLKAYVDMALSEKNIFDFTAAQKAHDAVGESFLLESLWDIPSSTLSRKLWGLSRQSNILWRKRSPYWKSIAGGMKSISFVSLTPPAKAPDSSRFSLAVCLPATRFWGRRCGESTISRG